MQPNDSASLPHPRLLSFNQHAAVDDIAENLPTALRRPFRFHVNMAFADRQDPVTDRELSLVINRALRELRVTG